MNEETFDTLLLAIESGETLKAAIKTAKTSYRALQLLCERDANAASRYARSRVLSSAYWADKAVETVEQAHDKESAIIARVRQDVYRWRARVANPKEYGDKLDVSGQVQVTHTLTAPERAERANALLSTLKERAREVRPRDDAPLALGSGDVDASTR
jgi:hypothetical protein